MRKVRVLPLGLLLSLGLAMAAQAQLDLKELGKSFGLGKKEADVLDKTLQTVKSLGPIGYEEERAIGGALAVEAFQRFGEPYRDPKLLHYVTLVGTTVAMHSDRTDIPYHFAILNNAQHNAFALPGGYVFVTIGLLRQLQSEAELAGVLGHEIAHITEKHALKTLRRSQVIRGVSELTMTALNTDPALFDQVINQLSTTLFDRGLDHKLEYEADRLGMKYAYRVGYSPQSLSTALKRLAKLRLRSHTGLFKTHPDPKKRAKRLKKVIRKKYGSEPGGQTLASRFSRDAGK